MNPTYLHTARLLTQVAPSVFADGIFALKGGTAINLFLRDMPRLSVDLDVVFPDHRVPRNVALAQIQQAMGQAAERLRARGFQTHSVPTGDVEARLWVRRESLQVKVEVNIVMRGTVAPVRRVGLSSRARDILQADLSVPMVAPEDVYGGKLVAAMDRQHPRDLFDVMQLFDHEGITDAIRKAFVVYLACSNRPVHEVLFPSMRDVGHSYAHNFQGMTAHPVALDQLLAARERMAHELQTGLSWADRTFLVSLVSGDPHWDVMGIPHLAHLPGVQWKLRHLQILRHANPRKFVEQAKLLADRLGVVL